MQKQVQSKKRKSSDNVKMEMDLHKVVQIAKAYNGILNAQRFIPEEVTKGGEKLAQKMVRMRIEEYKSAISGECETYLKSKLITDEALNKLEKRCQDLTRTKGKEF